MPKKTLRKKSNPLRTALVVFFALLLFILIIEKPGSQSAQKLRESEPLLFPRLRLEAVTHVTLARAAETPFKYELRRIEHGWIQGETPLNPLLMDEFLNSLHALTQEALVSNNPSKQALFQVDSASGLEVQLWKNSKPLTHFWIGKAYGPSGQYLRLEGQEEVFKTTPLIPDLLPALSGPNR